MNQKLNLKSVQMISIFAIIGICIAVIIVCIAMNADYIRYGDYSDHPCAYAETSANCQKPSILVVKYGLVNYYCEDHAEDGEEIWARIHGTYSTPRPTNKDADDTYYPARSCPVCGTGYRANSGGARMIAKHGYCKSLCGKRLNGN